MKRLWIGVGMLAVLLCSSLIVSFVMVELHRPMETELRQSGEAALSGDWETARSLAEKARERWEKRRFLTAAVADHSYLEDVDSRFLELEAWYQQRQPGEYAAVCYGISGMARGMADSQKAAWWNFL